MIDKIIKQRIEDGQLSECPLTLDELRKIKGTVDGTSGMLPVLRGIYHIRVEYPDDKRVNDKMIKITSDCDPSLGSPDVKCVQLIVKSVFEIKKSKMLNYPISFVMMIFYQN